MANGEEGLAGEIVDGEVLPLRGLLAASVVGAHTGVLDPA